MKKIFPILICLALVGVSCARQAEIDSDALSAEALAAYMQKYHPDAVKTTKGAWIYQNEEVAGTGEEYKGEAFIRMDYTITDRDGRFIGSTLVDVNKSNKNYSSRNYYGPMVRYAGSSSFSEGLKDMLKGSGTGLGPMKMGGTRKALVPSWLLGGTEAVYSITLVEAFEDVDVWEKDSLARYIAANYPDAVEDTLISGGGWYYVLKKAAEEETGLLTADSTIYCNYILRDLADRVIDTNVEKVAQQNGFYSSETTYSPALINWDSDYTKITMTTSETDVVDGFANAFLHMHQYETAIVIFRSFFGYSYSGSGNTIPAYCPLSFEIELVKAPN